MPALCPRCATSRLLSTTGSHGSPGPEFCTVQALLVHQNAPKATGSDCKCVALKSCCSPVRPSPLPRFPNRCCAVAHVAADHPSLRMGLRTGKGNPCMNRLSLLVVTVSLPAFLVLFFISFRTSQDLTHVPATAPAPLTPQAPAPIVVCLAAAVGWGFACALVGSLTNELTPPPPPLPACHS